MIYFLLNMKVIFNSLGNANRTHTVVGQQTQQSTFYRISIHCTPFLPSSVFQKHFSPSNYECWHKMQEKYHK